MPASCSEVENIVGEKMGDGEKVVAVAAVFYCDMNPPSTGKMAPVVIAD